MRYHVFICFFLLCSCSAPNPPKDGTLAGKTIEYRYGTSVYHVTFDTDSTLHWEAVAGEETGVKEDETYVAEWIESQKLFITWGEASGIGVSQVLNFETGRVHNHLLNGREVSMGEGEIRLLEK